MPAFYRASVREFLHLAESELTGRLTIAYAASGFDTQRTSQTQVWQHDLLALQATLDAVVRSRPTAEAWDVLLEFPIPRKEKRIDVVLLAGGTIFLLEMKSSAASSEALRQAEEYALLLHYFHQPSYQRKIIPLVVVPALTRQRTLNPQQFLPIVEAPAYWIRAVEAISWVDLAQRLCSFAQEQPVSRLDAAAWDAGEYRPVPSIIDAALSLQAGLGLREIAHSRAERVDVLELTHFIDRLIQRASTEKQHVICFVTGVPGSGKTLVGLHLAFGKQSRNEPIHFMSGNGPLVMVLQAALSADHQRRTETKADAARMYAKTLIENVHVFARHYADEAPEVIPSNRVIIFDEAQRAWDQTQNFAKFKRNYSEPEMLLRIMERHPDWAVVVALVGGGQEINSGEAGLGEWGRALALSTSKPWQIFASPEAIIGGTSVAGSPLAAAAESQTLTIEEEPRLHLDVSVRSLNAGSYATWVNHVVEGNQVAAAAMRDQVSFPILLTRSLNDLRLLLREHVRGESRAGLVASSKAARLRAEGLEPDSTFHGEYPWDKWYLAPASDVRASSQLEVYASEFEIQGLELDWIGLCWGGDFIWSPSHAAWSIRNFMHGRRSHWSEVSSETRRTFRRNAYRVLMTRARQGVVIYVPEGDANDPTRDPEEFAATADFLSACGARPARAEPPSDWAVSNTLF